MKTTTKRTNAQGAKSHHTKGEWKLKEIGAGITRVIDKDERILATVHGLEDGKDNPARILEEIANANRIVEAVNGYDALKKKETMHDEFVNGLKKIMSGAMANLDSGKKLDKVYTQIETLLKQAQ